MKQTMKHYTNLSKTKIKFRSKVKTNPSVVETLNLALKNKSWLSIAKVIAGSRRAYKKINLVDVENNSENGDVVVVIGKVLSGGDLTKKVKLRAMSYSKSAEEKLKASKIDYGFVLEEIKKNTKCEGVKLLK